MICSCLTHVTTTHVWQYAQNNHLEDYISSNWKKNGSSALSIVGHGDHLVLICFLPNLVEESCMDDKSSNGIPSTWLWDNGKMCLTSVMDPGNAGSDSAVADKHCYNMWHIFNH